MELNYNKKEFPSYISEEDATYYNSMLRYLTIMEYFFIEIETDEGWFISTTTGLYKMDKETGEFSRVREVSYSIPVAKLTYYEDVLKHDRETLAKNREILKNILKQDKHREHKVCDEDVNDIRYDTEHTDIELAIKYRVPVRHIRSIRKLESHPHIPLLS